MSEERIIIEIQSNAADQQKKVDDLRLSILNLRESQKEELAIAKVTGKSVEDINKLKVQQKNELDKLNESLKSETRQLKILNDIQNSEADTIKRVKAELALVTSQWNESYKVTGENSEATKQLAAEKLRLTEVLKSEEKATGDTRRNVGNYTEGVKDALTQSGLFTKQSQAMAAAQTMAAGAVNVLKVAFGSLKAAIISIGIGALVIGLVSLVQAFRSTEEGASKLQKVFSPFLILLGNITDILADFGMGLIDLFTGNFSAAADNFKKSWEGIKNVISDTAKETKENNQLIEAKLALQKREREAQIEIAKLDQEIARNRLIAADKENQSNEERLSAIRQAIAAEEKVLKINEELATKRLDNIKLANSFNKTNKEGLDEEAKLEADLIRVQTDSFNKRKEMTAQVAEISNQIRADEAKNETDRLKAIDDDLKSKLKAEEEKRKAFLLTSKIENDLNDELLKDAESYLEESSKALEVALKNDQKIREENAKKAAALTDELLSNDIIKMSQKYEYQKSLIENEIKDEVVKNNALLALRKKYDEDLQAMDEARRMAQLDSLARSLGQLAGLFEDNTAAYKVFASAEAVISTWKGVASALSSALPPPLPQIDAAARLAAGLAAVAKINEVKFADGGILTGNSHQFGGVQMYGKGGNYYGEAEGGEVILTKNVSRNPHLLAAASRINESAGGRSFFANGGIVQAERFANSMQMQKQIITQPVLVVQDVTELQDVQSRVKAMARY